MKPIVDLPGQLFFWDLGESQRRRPTPAEIEEAITWAAQIAIRKNHRGRPPLGMTFDDLRQEVSMRAYRRLKNFQHGGKKTLREYTYKSCQWSLVDLQRENMNKPIEVQSYPLFESI